MKIKFKSEETRVDFACRCEVNAAIAEYMGLGVHEAVNHPNGNIQLVDNGCNVEINTGHNFNLYVIFFMDERKYITIDGE